MGTYSAWLVVLCPLTTMLGPVVELRVTRLDGADQVMRVALARMGETVAPMVAPGAPVRMEGETAGLIKGPAATICGVSAGPPVTAMRKTSLPSLAYFARALAGSQLSAGPLGAAR